MDLWQLNPGGTAIRPHDQIAGGSTESELSTSPGQWPESAVYVMAARNGDRVAFGWLYEHYFRLVHGILLARVPNTDVRDLVQDVFLSALRKLPSLRNPAAFGGWLAQIARNRASDYYRRSDHSAHQSNEQAAVDLSARPEKRSDAFAALCAIRALPEAYRETLILRFVEGMTGPEIAARTGLTPASVRVNLHRGIKLLRDKLAWGARP